jgi:hypothetical protein
MALLLTKARTLLALGLPNILRVAIYKSSVRLGINRVRRLEGSAPTGPFFSLSQLVPVAVEPVSAWRDSGLLFSYLPIPVTDSPPDWLANPLTGKRVPSPELPWWEIPDFDPEVGDIKLIWELSRMDWVLAFAQRARQGDTEALGRLNNWLFDWCANNPPYRGPNWKCGQEASIRIIHLAAATLILGQVHETSPSLQALVALHLERIVPTLQYAVAQDNNHGTSEAAALFIGGGWLLSLGDNRGRIWADTGRKLLENRAGRLIGKQGTFSQYSLNYHRLMLDTLSMAECWRRALQLPAFSPRFLQRALVATQWLHSLIDPHTGDGPNVGANDGARILQLVDAPYRDYRPSVQMAMVLFAGQRAYQAGDPVSDALQWLGLTVPEAAAPAPDCLSADDGGFLVMRRGAALALLRYPRFRFRPSQADILHLDFWLRGRNVLRDAGTYSYNADVETLNYFGGVAGHNTVQFEGREQMPRLSRFLLGDWLRTERLLPFQRCAEFVGGGVAYRDAFGAKHQREVVLFDRTLQVKDSLENFSTSAVMRWRLAPGDWVMKEGGGRSGDSTVQFDNSLGQVLSVSASVPVVRCELVSGWESRHYLEKTSLPVLEVEVAQPGVITTELRWT